jgi:MYXO-CTERM domain-containing protein
MKSGMRAFNWMVGAWLVVALSLVEGRSSAHHSFAMFDFTKTVTFKATVKEFQWTNPHVIVSFAVDADAAEPETWWAELTSPGNLTRVGWSKRAFKTGDRVEITIHPLRDGTRGGAFTKATLLETGQVWTSDLRAQEKPELGVGEGVLSANAAPATAPAARSGACAASAAGAGGRGSVDAFAALALMGMLARRRRGAHHP